MAHTNKTASLVLLTLGLLAATRPAQADILNLNPTADARILSIGPNTNFATDILAVFNEGPGFPGNIQHTLIRFDLSGIPAGSTINSATLTLFQGLGWNGVSGTFATHIFRVDRAWDETQVTWLSALAGTPWTNPGGDFVGTTGVQNVNPYLSQNDSFGAAQQTYTYPITNLVSQWAAGTPNNGLLLRADTGSSLHWMGHRDSVTQFRPLLSINFTPAASVATPEPGSVALILFGLALPVQARSWKRR